MQIHIPTEKKGEKKRKCHDKIQQQFELASTKFYKNKLEVRHSEEIT
jgi:hypothetical protein